MAVLVDHGITLQIVVPVMIHDDIPTVGQCRKGVMAGPPLIVLWSADEDRFV